MNETRRMVVLSELIEALDRRGSWCGETHIQKNAYFLDELLGVPFEEYDFILYKHGPFSFELRNELTGMRADGLLALEAQPYPYGPSLVTTDLAQNLKSRFRQTLERYRPAVEFVAEHLGNKGVVELERLATALYVTRELPNASVEDRAQRLVHLKPHVPLTSATNAVERVDQIMDDAQALAN
jgi:uncharacterized protein YwgA